MVVSLTENRVWKQKQIFVSEEKKDDVPGFDHIEF